MGSGNEVHSVGEFSLDAKWIIDPKQLFVGPKIGEGAHAKVYEGKYKNQNIAVKIINKGETPEEISRREARFGREVAMLSKVQHKNLVRFIGACKEPVMVIVTELLLGGTLRKYLLSMRPTCLDMRVAVGFALDIARAMECLHSHGIIHRDLKPDNLILTGDHRTVKLADFGLAREESLTEMMTAETGTYRWMAPELYSTVTLRQGEKKHYNHKVDAYSFAIVLWELIHNKLPFEGMSNLQAAYAAAFKNTRPSAEDLPEDLAMIVTSCWKEDPNDRPNFSQIIQMLLRYLSTISPSEPVAPMRMTSSDNIVLPPESPGTSALMFRRDDPGELEVRLSFDVSGDQAPPRVGSPSILLGENSIQGRRIWGSTTYTLEWLASKRKYDRNVVVPLGQGIEQRNIGDDTVSFYCYVKPLNLLNGSLYRSMSTTRGRSMRSKVERRMQKESGKTLREIRRAKKLKKKLMTEEERLVYNLKRAKKKIALLLQKLKKYDLPELPPPRHDPELFTPEQLQAYKKIGFKNKNYVPVGVRGVFGGVVQNMHLHWKFHETVQVCCDNFPKEKIKEMASMLARLSGGIVLNVHNVKTIIMFRGRNYRQPKNLIPINTLTKRKALFKARFEQALESQKLNIKKIEQELRRMGVNPEDPTAMASIQRVASTFFNAIDKKEGSPYVFRGDKPSIIEPNEGLDEADPSADSDQEELDQFIADIEDAADKEYEEEEAKEKEEFGRLRYWNREEYGGRFRRSDDSRNDDYDGEVRGSRARQPIHPKYRTNNSDNEENAHFDNDDEDDEDDDEWHSGSIVDDIDIDIDNNSDGPDEARGRFKESRGRGERKNNVGIGKAQISGGPSRHSEAKFMRNMAIQGSESEGTLSEVENAMWESDEEENNSVHLKRASSGNYKSSSSDDDEHNDQLKSNKKNGVRGHNSFNTRKNGRGRQEGIGRTKSESTDALSVSEDWTWQSDGEEESRADVKDSPTSLNNRNVVKSDIHKKRSPKGADEAWDSD